MKDRETQDLEEKLKTFLIVKDDSCGPNQTIQWKLDGLHTPEHMYKMILECDNLINPQCLNLMPVNEAIELIR
jgi:hypothetical protein